MMESAIIGAAIVLGIILIIIEILFVPGTTFVGVIGFILIAAGVYFTYDIFGPTMGTYALVGSVVLCSVLVIYSFRSGSWKFMSNKSVIDAKVNDHKKFDLKVGDKGVTVSVLRPMGKALFGEEHYEVSTLGQFIEANIDIQILEINGRELIVELVQDIQANDVEQTPEA